MACGRRGRRKTAYSTCLCIKGYCARFSFYVGGEAESGTPSTSTQHEGRRETRKKKRANEIDRNRPERGRIFKPVLCSALSGLPASCRSHYCANCALCLCHVCQKCSPNVRRGDSHCRNMTKVVPSPCLTTLCYYVVCDNDSRRLTVLVLLSDTIDQGPLAVTKRNRKCAQPTCSLCMSPRPKDLSQERMIRGGSRGEANGCPSSECTTLDTRRDETRQKDAGLEPLTPTPAYACMHWLSIISTTSLAVNWPSAGRLPSPRQPASRLQGPRKRDGETVQCPSKPVRKPWKLGEPRAHRSALMGARGGTIVTICGMNTAEGAPSIENRIMA